MPIYAYKCLACGHQLEKIQRLSDASLTDCPECGQAELKKQITAAAFKLTGSGWYETDFKNNKTDKEKSAADTSTNTDKSDSKTDSGSKSKDSKSETSSSSAKDSSKKDAA